MTKILYILERGTTLRGKGFIQLCPTYLDELKHWYVFAYWHRYESRIALQVGHSQNADDFSS